MQCPFCKEEIQEGAIKCKHCGATIESAQVNVSTVSHSKNLFSEIIEDITQKKDVDTIIGIISAIWALIFVFTGASTNTFINFLFFINPAAAGWVVKSGMIARENGEKPKLLIIGGVSLLLVAFQLLYLSNGLSQLASLAKFWGQ